MMKPIADLRRNPTQTGLAMAIRIAKIASLSLGIVSVLLLLVRSAVPYSAAILSSALPRLWSSFRAWLVPPYLFITVHLIILTIWKLSETKRHLDRRPEETKPSDTPIPIKPRDLAADSVISLLRKPSLEIWPDIAPSAAVPRQIPPEPDAAASGSVESSPEPASGGSCITTDSEEGSADSSSRLEIKKSVKEAEGEENETLEATWNAISLKTKVGAEPAAAAAAVAATVGRGLRKAAVAMEEAEERGSEGPAVGYDDRRFDEFIKEKYAQMGR